MDDSIRAPKASNEITLDLMAINPFLKDFAPEHLKTLNECASLVQFGQSEYLYLERELSENLYILERGKVSIEVSAPGGGNPWVIMTASAGGMVGFGWLYPPHRNPFSCRALEDVTVVCLKAQSLLAKFEENHELGYRFMKCCTHILGERLWASRLQMLSLILKDGR